MAQMSGAKFMADTLKAYGVTHVFLVPAILRRALAEMDLIGNQACDHARRESRRLHGGRLCPRLRQTRRVHGPVGGRRQPRCRAAGRVPWSVSGHRIDRPQAQPTSSTGTPTRKSNTPSPSPRSPSSARWWTTPINCPTCCARPSVRLRRERQHRFTWTSRG